MPKLIRVRLHPTIREYEIEVVDNADEAHIIRAVEATAHMHFQADYEEIPFTEMNKAVNYQELPAGVLIHGQAEQDTPDTSLSGTTTPDSE